MERLPGPYHWEMNSKVLVVVQILSQPFHIRNVNLSSCNGEIDFKNVLKDHCLLNYRQL